jgi:WS/DGAT/MGAT family acyltransferase
MAWRELRHSAISSPLGRKVGANRRIAFASAPVGQLKRLGKVVDPAVTLNDVVLCVAAGGLRRWLEAREVGLGGLRVKVPVSLHGHDGGGEAPGNHNSFMFVDLPVEEADPVRRLLAINAETRERKNHHDAEMIDNLFRDLGHLAGLNRVAQRWAMSPREFTLNISNVPGPREPVSVLGARLRELYFVAEVGQLHALRISVVSAQGSMNFGLCADSDAVEDLEEIAAGIEAEITELSERVTSTERS